MILEKMLELEEMTKPIKPEEPMIAALAWEKNHPEKFQVHWEIEKRRAMLESSQGIHPLEGDPSQIFSVASHGFAKRTTDGIDSSAENRQRRRQSWQIKFEQAHDISTVRI